jgi:hypothetical protein
MFPTCPNPRCLNMICTNPDCGREGWGTLAGAFHFFMERRSLCKLFEQPNDMILDGDTRDTSLDCSVCSQAFHVLLDTFDYRGAGVEHPTNFAAEEAECAHKVLDDRLIPRTDKDGKTYSLVGRIVYAIEHRLDPPPGGAELKYQPTLTLKVRKTKSP